MIKPLHFKRDHFWRRQYKTRNNIYEITIRTPKILRIILQKTIKEHEYNPITHEKIF